MSSRIFQSVIVQMKEATSRCIGVIDDHGFVVACSELSMIGSRVDEMPEISNEVANQICSAGNRTFKILGSLSSQFDYAVFVEGTDETARCVCILSAVAISEARENYEEKHNKGTFIKNLISDNILPGDIYVRAKELHFVTDVPRAVLLVRQLNKADVAAVEIIQALFQDRQKDFVLNLGESDVVIIKELPPDFTEDYLVEVAQSVEDTMAKELSVRTVIGIGTPAQHLRELADRYKEAQTAIEVGKVFDTEKSIIHYENLGIGRLIYQLPVTLCEMFLSEVFKKNPIESLDQETL